MIQRCTNPANQDFERYLGRGITVCDRWLNSFENFLADMGLKPSPKHEIERSNNDLGYFPENCVWSTRKRQNLNKKTTLRVNWNGKEIPLMDACEQAGIAYNIAKQRLRLGWSHELTLSTPRLKYGQRKPR